jgi:hypothetical protein
MMLPQNSKKKGTAARQSPSFQRALEAEAFKNPQNRSDCCCNRSDCLSDGSHFHERPPQIFGHRNHLLSAQLGKTACRLGCLFYFTSSLFSGVTLSGYNSVMSSSLLHADEETDMGVYGAYLRAQTDTDLMDIALHLDPDKYPARQSAAGRELNRRGLLHASGYTAAEAGIRYGALAAFALSFLLLALTLLLTPTDAAGPSWPTPEMLPDGLPMGEFTRLFIVAMLRGTVVWGAHFGWFCLLPLYLGGWVLRYALPLYRRRARADVWRLALLAFAALFVSLCAAVCPSSAVPALFTASAGSHSTAQRCLPLWDPFASAPAPSNTDSFQY